MHPAAHTHTLRVCAYRSCPFNTHTHECMHLLPTTATLYSSCCLHDAHNYRNSYELRMLLSQGSKCWCTCSGSSSIAQCPVFDRSWNLMLSMRCGICWQNCPTGPCIANTLAWKNQACRNPCAFWAVHRVKTTTREELDVGYVHIYTGIYRYPRQAPTRSKRIHGPLPCASLALFPTDHGSVRMPLMACAEEGGTRR